MKAKLRILLAEDHHVVRAGPRALIDAEEDLEVVAEAADGESACRLAAELAPDLAPDLAVMDVSMPLPGALTVHPACRLPGALDPREEQADADGDDRDHHR